MTQQLAEQIMKHSGTDGKFYEPRTEDGRKPHPEFQVIWLPNKSYAEALLAMKMTKVEVTLVRSRDRYGLRARQDHAEEVHSLHRPELQWLAGTDLKRYRMGPLPYGSKRTSVVNVCKKWGWNSRPIEPIQQSADRTGNIWQVLASEPPRSWIYQLHHGDVLISAEQEGPVQPPVQQAVLASQRTWQSLTQPSTASTKDKDDPWQHHDPWQQYSKPKELTSGQVKAIEDSIEAKIVNKLKSDDTTMNDADAKINELESKLESLQSSMTTFQASQQQQNQVVQQQLLQMDSKVDAHAQSFQASMESKLEDQMRKIEQLFHKRGPPE